MKKYLHFSRFLVLLVGLLTISANSAWGENATYTKVTSSLTDWSGDYLIVYESGNVAFDGSRSTLDATNNGTAVTISDGSITTDSKYEFHITKDGDVYYIQSASGYYIWGTSSNGLSSNSTKSSAKGNTISYSEGIFTIKGSGGTKTLSYNNDTGQKRFRYLGTTLIQLYRKSASVTYTDYLTECESCDRVSEELRVTAAATTLTIGSDDKASTTLSTSGGNNGTITFSVTPDGTASISGNSITFTAAGPYTVIASQDKTDGKCSQRATVDITVNPRQYTLTFVDRGNTHDTQQHKAGEKATKPDDPTGVCTEPTEYVFDGWAERTVNAENEYTKVDFNTYTMPAKDTKLYAVYRYVKDGTNQEVTFDASDISNLTEITSLSWKENTSNVTLTLSEGQRYTNGTPNTFTVTKGNTNYFEVTSNSDIQKVVVEISEGNYTINISKKDNGVTVTTADENLIQTLTVTTPKKSVKGYALASYQTRMKKITVTCGTILYTSDPACGPHIGLMGDVRITSAKDVRVDAYTKITVSGTNLDKNEDAAAVSIKAESNNPNFKIKRWGTKGDGNDAYSGNSKSWTLATNILGATYADSLCITYTPTAFNAFDTATITLTAYRYNGSTVYATKTITVLGHSLPERFVIAAKGTDGWVALPNTLGSNSSATVPNVEDINGDVDDSNNPTKLTTAPSNVIYTAAARGDSYKNNSQTGLRFTVDGGQFLQASKNEPTVWLSTTDWQDMQSWTLRTEDFTDYVVRLDSGSRYNRSLSYYKNATTERIGHYTTNTAIRFLPFDTECTRLLAPANLKVTQVKSSAITLAWDAVAGAIGYAYSTDEGTTWTEMGNVLTYTITGLTAKTPYTIWVKGVVPVGDTDCSDYGTVSAKTTNCDDVPYDISYTSDVNSITLSWTMTAGTATVQVFSNADETGQVDSDYTGATSPYTITGLTKATTYYVKILADGSCPSALVEVSTERPQLDVVEWKPDGIDVAINTNEKISVVLENQVTKGSGTGNVAEDLFFSKYYEAKGDLKMLGIFNGTDHDIDLTNIRIWGAKEDASEWKKEGSTSPNNYVNLGKIKQTILSGEEMILFTVGNYFDGEIGKYTKSSEYPNGYTETSHPDNWYLVGVWGTGARDTNGNMGLNFSGAYSLALVDVIDAENPQMIDVIGAGTVSAPASGGVGQSPTCTMDGNTSAFSATGEDFEGNEADISTNSFLLVRKNTVVSGAKAVEHNTTYFKTLGNDYFDSEGINGEWVGKSVCAETSSTKSKVLDSISCSYFDYVSTFDYSGYYTTYDSLTTIEFEESERNPDGTVTIPIDYMDTLACKGLKIIAADEGGNVLTTKDYKVPILVTSNATTADKIFSHFGGDTCKTCDVVVRDKATLTKATDGTANDKPQVRDVKIYEGASLVVPSGTNYTVNSLSLRRKEDAVSTVDVAGTLTFSNTSSKPVYLDLRINAENWHWFTLPYDCAIADVTWSNGQPAEYGTEWFLMDYDGKTRAATQTTGGNWKEYEGTTIAAGQGFIVGIKGDGNDKHAYELRFPMAKEVITAEKDNKDVAGMKAYGAGTDIRPNHKGWNLVGNPYLNYYKRGNINSFDGLQLSELIYDPVTGWYSLGTDNNPYVVIPQNFGWSAYEQVLVSSQDLLPFTSYFIQVGKDGDIDGKDYSVNFISSNRGKSAKAALMTSAAEEVEEEPVITGIVLRNAQGEQDETSLVIAERFGSSYEMGADFFKWFGDYYKYYTLPVLYSIGEDGGKRAFNAVNEEGAKQSIPLGMYAARDGQYTFSLNTRSDLSRVDKVWLYDAESGRYTDLLREDYPFATTRTEGSGRFFLSVVLKEKEITTSAANARYGDLTLYADKQTLIVRGLPEEAEVWVYDPSGKLLHHEQTRHYERQYDVPQQGTYLVRVESQDGGVTLRGVCR